MVIMTINTTPWKKGVISNPISTNNRKIQITFLVSLIRKKPTIYDNIITKTSYTPVSIPILFADIENIFNAF